MMEYAMGLMSGTSMDGIDVAVIDVHTHDLIVADTFPYSLELANQIRRVMQGDCFNADVFALLNRQIGIEFGYAAFRILQSMSSEQVHYLKVIGSHGQTVCHHPIGEVPYTWQMGCPHSIAQICHKPVVFDFRNGNVAQGGQGAPLAPLYHQQLFGRETEAVVVNIGGISNLSMVSPTQMRGYDVGPGNCLMDAWIHRHLGLSYDQMGTWAASGTVLPELLAALLQDPFIYQAAPKSIGKEYYSLTWLEHYLQNGAWVPQDVQATLCAYTAEVIAQEIREKCQPNQLVWLCGGGAKNQEVVNAIRHSLPQFQVKLTSEGGISEDFLEAMMMAWFAWMRYTHKPVPLYSIMGGVMDAQLVGMICE